MDETTSADEYVAAVEGSNPDTYDEKPIPVSIVDTVTVQDFPPVSVHTEQIPVPVSPAQPIRVLGNVPTRFLAHVCAKGGAVYIGDRNVTTASGYEVPTGTTVKVSARGELWAIAPAAGAAVHVLTEHRDG